MNDLDDTDDFDGPGDRKGKVFDGEGESDEVKGGDGFPPIYSGWSCPLR